MTKPKTIDPLADRVLQRLAGSPESAEIVLGGYLALQHYVDYRATHDIDAWWRERATPQTEKAIHEIMRTLALEEGCELREKHFGETSSFEMVRAGRKCFSFQIAVRSVQLEPPILSAWPPVLIETLADTVGSKMNALVDRGSPRDFLDIRMIVTTGLLPTQKCWELWLRKNAGHNIDEGRQKVMLHLTSLEARRPLQAIGDVAEREQAGQLRGWFRDEFLNT